MPLLWASLDYEDGNVDFGRDRSDQDRDYVDKRKEYYAIHVREYVIVDRFRETVLVLTYEPDGDFRETWLAENDTYETLLLPGLSVSLAEVFGC